MDTIDKTKWARAADGLYSGTLTELWGDFTSWGRLDKHKDGYYETPKKYINGVAHNDGSWLRYKTERWSHGKLVTKIRCSTKKDVIKILFEYICFLKLDGVTNKDEMVYYTMKLIIDKLFIPEGLFEYDDQNRKLLYDLVDAVLKKPNDEIRCNRKDPRSSCFDPSYTTGLSKTTMMNVGKKVKKNERSELIAKYYRPGMSYRQVAKIMNEDGIKISKTTIERWVKDNE